MPDSGVSTLETACLVIVIAGRHAAGLRDGSYEMRDAGGAEGRSVAAMTVEGTGA